MANAAELYSTCIGLERQLREELKHKNFYEAAVRSVRTQLRSAYEAVLFADYAGSQAREVEPALWKSVYYRPIEEFRRRIKAAAAAGERGREPLQKVKAAFGKFLQEGARFYRELALKLQLAFGNAGFSMADAQLDALPAMAEQHTQQDCSASVYRCLICLGDIFRYETSVLQNQQKKDWSSAARHYHMAMKVYPQGGNSYNQLAVLSTYNGDDLAAVYFYFRSLAVEKPFTIARENLVLLLEQIRQKYSKLPQPAQAKVPQQSTSMKHKRPVNILMQELSIRVAHLYGTLFSKVNLSDCEQILPAAIFDVQDFLSRDGALQAFTHKANSPQGANNVLLQLAVLSMFSLFDVSGSSAKLGYADAVKQDVLNQAVLRVAQTVIAALAEAVVNATRWERVDAAVLPSLAILLEWWAATPAVSSQVDVPQPATGTNPELTASLSCLKHLTDLVGVIKDRLQQGGSATEEAVQTMHAMVEDSQLRGFLPLQSCHDKLKLDQPSGQDAIAVWLTRAQTALSNIADHQVQLQEGTAAQQQLSKAWWGFRDKVHPAVLAAQQANIPIAAAEHIAAASASAVAAAPTASLNGGPVSSKAGAADVQPGVLSVNGPKASSGQEPDDGEEEEEVILFRPQQGPQPPTSSATLGSAPPGPSTLAPPQPTALPPDSYAARLGGTASVHQLAHQPQLQQHLQPQLLQQQQQQAVSSRASEAYATGIAAVAPTLLPSSSLLSLHAQPASATPLARPLSAHSLLVAQQHQQQRPQLQPGLLGAFSRSHPDLTALQTAQSTAGQGSSGFGPQQVRPEHDLGGYAATQQGSLQQRPASVPAGGALPIGPGASARGFGLVGPSHPAATLQAQGNLVPQPGSQAAENYQLHNLSSLAHGPGSSAVGSPGYGQFTGASHYGVSGNPAQPSYGGTATGQMGGALGQFGAAQGHLGPGPGQFAAAQGAGQGLYGRPDLGGSLFAGRSSAAGLNSDTGSYHPFGMQAQPGAGLELASHFASYPTSLSSYSQAAPGPYQAQSAHSGQLSSAGSDRASPALGAGVHTRTNLAAQMGVGSSPNLQSLDGLGLGLGAQQGFGLGLQQAPQPDQLTWQQQLLAQQQSLQHPAASGMSHGYSHGYSHGTAQPSGFQNHLGHQLPPVPTWQSHLPGQQGQYGGLQGFAHPPEQVGYPSNAAQGPQANSSQQSANQPHLGSNAWNWQQQLQHAQGGGNGLLGHNLPPPYGTGGGGSVGSASSPSAAAADSWSWLDAFEHKQQSERAATATWPASNAPQQGPALW